MSKIARMLALTAVLITACVCGCKPLPKGEGHVPIWKRVLRDDFFFDHRSHDIERNLERENRVSIQ